MIRNYFRCSTESGGMLLVYTFLFLQRDWNERKSIDAYYEQDPDVLNIFFTFISDTDMDMKFFVLLAIIQTL